MSMFGRPSSWASFNAKAGKQRVKRPFPKLLMTKMLQGPRCQLLAAGLVLCTWDDNHHTQQRQRPLGTATLPYISLLLMYVPGRTILALFLYQYGSLTRYAKLRVVHAPGMPGTFSPSSWVSDPDMHHGTCVTHVPWCMPGSLTSGFLWSRNPPCCVSCKRHIRVQAKHTQPNRITHNLATHHRAAHNPAARWCAGSVVCNFHRQQCRLHYFSVERIQTFSRPHRRSRVSSDNLWPSTLTHACARLLWEFIDTYYLNRKIWSPLFWKYRILNEICIIISSKKMFLQVAGIEHYIDVTRTPWRLLSPTTHLFVQQPVQANNKWHVIAPHHWPLWGESIGDRWFSLTKGQ